MARLKDDKNDKQFRRQQRDKRRAKMIFDQTKLQQEVELRKRQELVLLKLTQQSRQEKEIEYQIWRAEQCQKIIQENRQLRSEQYHQKTELVILNAKFKEEQMLKVLQQQYETDVKQKLIQQQELIIENKQMKRKANYNECSQLVQAILDMTENCFDHTQNFDNQEFDNRFWKQCIDLFVNGLPQIPSKQARHYDTVPNLKRQQNSEEIKPSRDQVALIELSDYLNGKGIWKPQHQYDSPNPNDIFTDQKFVPNLPLNNTLLGDLMYQVLEEKYPNQADFRENFREKRLPTYLPLQIALKGYQFSGKKTIAEYIQKKYGIELLSVDELIKDLFKRHAQYQQQMSSISSQQGGDLRPNSRATNSRNSRKSENMIDIRQEGGDRRKYPPTIAEKDFIDEESLDLVKEIKNCVMTGEPITDILYVKLISKQIRELFPAKTKEEFFEFYSKLQAKKNDNNESFRTENSIPPTKEETLKKILLNNNFRYTQGWLLVDFPHTYQQAKLLESKLTGWVPEDEVPQTEFQQQLETLKLIVSPTETLFVKRKQINGGLSSIFYIDISKEDSIKRAIGRRIDSVTNQLFHLDTNVPPCDNAPLNQRVQNIRDFDSNELSIVEKNCEMDQNLGILKEFYSNFGNEWDQRYQKDLGFIEEEYEETMVVPQTEEEIKEEQALAIKQTDLGGGAKNVKGAPPPPPPKPIEETKTITVQKKRTVQQFDEEVVHYERHTWNSIKGDCPIDQIFYQIDSMIVDILNLKEKEYENIGNSIQETIKAQFQREENEQIQKANDAQWLFSQREEIIDSVTKMAGKKTLHPDVLNNIINLWGAVENNYLKTVKQTFSNLREQREFLGAKFADIQRRFLELLTRNDNKMYFVQKYQVEYNRFISQNPDMPEENDTQEELHQRVQDLNDTLFDIIQSQKDDAIEQRNQIMNSQFIENEIERFLIQVQCVLQAELSRSFACQQIISDYYTNLIGDEPQDIPDYTKIDLVKNYEELPPQEGDNMTFPRLDKLVDLALQLHNGEQEIDDPQNAKKGGKAPPPPAQQDDKKAAKKGGKQEDIEEKKEETPLEIERRKAIFNEKAIFRYRVNVIRDTALSRLKEMRIMTNVLYSKLQDWINYTVRVENDAVNQLLNIFRSCIEDEKKIQKEMQLNYVDVVCSHQILNFLTPPPIILPAREDVRLQRFTISQLYTIHEELQTLSDTSNCIENRNLLQLFIRKTKSTLGNSELPGIWKQNKIDDYQRLIKNLDPKSTGSVHLQDLMVYLCLLSSPLLGLEDEAEYKNNLIQQTDDGGAYIYKQSFINTPSWFDSYEEAAYEDNSNNFQRPQYIKELLFHILKDNNELLDIEVYLNILKGANYVTLQQRTSSLENYNSLLFKQD